MLIAILLAIITYGTKLYCHSETTMDIKTTGDNGALTLNHESDSFEFKLTLHSAVKLRQQGISMIKLNISDEQ